jgi:hypothetical protein
VVVFITVPFRYRFQFHIRFSFYYLFSLVLKLNCSEQADPNNVKQAFILHLLLIIVLLPGIMNAQQVHTYVDADSLKVGDLFQYTVVLNGNYENAEFPAEEDFEEELTLQSMQRYQTPSGSDSLVYKLQFFAVEDITISRKEILLQNADGDTVLTTTPVPLSFKSVVAEGEEEFRPLKPIFEFARTWWPYLLALLLLLGGGYYLYRKYQTEEPKPEPEPEPKPIAPFQSPLVELKETIGTLPEISSLKSHEEYETFYIQLGDAIRRYIKKVYQFPALEMTTTEISLRLQSEHASPKIINITRKVLTEADIVKFANFHPGAKQAETALHKAEQFIETAEVVNREQIQYLKYRYETESGLREGGSIKTVKEE